MITRCAMCDHWRQTSAFRDYDGGYPGKCLAPVPLWVGLIHGTKTTDRIVSSNTDARKCDACTATLE